jgi:DNA repair exonuclease SbcCD ATPase subunit
MTVRLKRLQIEGFRGFAECRPIDLDADVIIVRGDNGTGKTSMVDALLWLFCGELAHLVERVRGLRRTEDAVTSRFNPDGATVTLIVAVDGIEHLFTRTGNERSNRLNVLIADEMLEDAAAEARLAEVFGIASAAELWQAVTTWGLLRQDAIRAALDAAGGALHERLSGLIGLEKVTAFATATTRASDSLIRERTAARAAREQAKQRHVDALHRRDEARQAAGSPSEIAALLADGMRAVRAQLPATVNLIVNDAADIEIVTQLGATIGRVVEALEAVQRGHQTLAKHPNDPGQLAQEAEAAAAAAERAAKESAEQAPALVQLASSAIGLLGDRCPVCDQPIDEAFVRSHLQEVLDRSHALAAGAQESQDALVRAQADLARVRGVLADRRTAVEGLDALQTELSNVLADVNDRLNFNVGVFDESTVDALLEALSNAVARLAELARTVNQASGSHMTRLADEADAAGTEVAAADEHVVSLEERCGRARELVHAAHQAARDILENALGRLGPSFAEVFDRLSPNPAFTELVAKQDVMRNRNQIVPIVRDRERDIEANPLLVFSEGQLNVVALSYFLGMALNARDAALPFLVLDDPLQALDVIAILSFGDLCRQIREQRQLIVTTHDRRFADVLVRKLAPRDTGQTLLVHEFQGWTRNGPMIETSRPEPEAVIRLLQQRAS